MSAALELDHVAVDYHRKRQAPLRAVADASLVVEHGQVHALVGESGCGKSTLARACAGLIAVSAGTITFDGSRVQALRHRSRPRHLLPLQLIFQDPAASLNPRRTVGSQLQDALMRTTASSRDARRAQVRELLESVGLPRSVARGYPRDFSGGQRQRICIARALAMEPRMLVADEPIAALDASAQAQIANLLVRLARERNIGLLFISHDLAIVRHIADVVTVMYLGKVVESTTTGALWTAPQHPYSEALIAAEPAHDGSGQLPSGLPGEVPSPASPPPGCRFHPRCPQALERCDHEEPPMFQVDGKRRAACWLRERAVSD